MKRTATGFCVAAAFASMATLGAQTSTTPTAAGQSAMDKSKDVSVTGCLSKGADGKYMLTNAMMDNSSASPSSSTAGSTTAGTTTAGTTTAGTTTGTTAGTAGTTAGATASAASSRTPAMSFMLAGGSDLDKHVGHKIQVTGKTNWDSSMDHGRSTASTPPAAGTTAGTTGTSGTTATAATEEQRKEMRADQPRLDVQSVKMIAPSCS